MYHRLYQSSTDVCVYIDRLLNLLKKTDTTVSSSLTKQVTVHVIRQVRDTPWTPDSSYGSVHTEETSVGKVCDTRFRKVAALPLINGPFVEGISGR